MTLNDKDIDAKIGEAWKAHYAGQDEEALRQFEALVEQYPDHIDALWGLGLAYRDAHKHEDATRIFKKIRDLIAQLIADEEMHGQPGRYFMLNRMVSQQIEQIDRFLES